jgi:long-chain acyl-CoA synthetase
LRARQQYFAALRAYPRFAVIMTLALPQLTESTLGDTLRAVADRHPDRPAILWEGSALTYAQWDSLADRLANHLIGDGLAAGDRVGLWMDKRPEVAVGFQGIGRAGCVAVPVNFKLPDDKQRFQVHRFGLQALLTQRSHLQQILHVLESIPAGERMPLPRVIVVDDEVSSEGTTPWTTVVEAPSSRPSHTASVDDLVYLNMTSGTTGRPKAGITTHAMIQWNTRSSIETLGYTADDVFLCMFSVFAHPHELFARPLALGGTCALVDSLNARAVARAIERHRVTWMMAVPSFYEMLARHAASTGADLSSLRMLEAGGAHLPPEAYERISRSLGAPLVPVWGSTETTGVGIAQRVVGERTPGAMGYVARHYEARVVNPDGAEASPGELGELWMKGPAVVGGYWGDRDETQRHFAGGWYRTDDLVTRGEDGVFTFCGRRSEMMKIGGIRVFPLEIELALRTHPDVADAVVVRAEEELRGEIARAVVIPQPGAEVTVRQLRDHCRARLALYQVPRMIELWDEIPRTPAGKVDKLAIGNTPPRG